MTGGVGGARPGGSRFRADIEGLRALAVLLVLVYHAGLPGLTGGFAGVDVFFVVSGFVITAQLLREIERDNHLSLMTFYGRRAKRLLPAAALVIVVTAIAARLLAPATQLRDIGTDLVASSIYVINWVFAGRAVDYLAEDVDPSPVQHYWSLAVEEQFYIVWPLIILLLIWVSRRAERRAAPTRRLLAIGLTVLVVLPSFATAMYLTSTDPARAFFVTHTRLWELGVGALIALGARAWGRLPAAFAALLAWAGVLTILVGAFVQDSGTPWPGPGALVPVLGTAAVIVGGFAAGRAGAIAVLGIRPLVWIGALSYSLYLWHWALLRIATWQFGELSPAAGLVVVTLSFLPAWLSYTLVEQPIRHSKLVSASPRLALSIGANATLAGVIAGLLIITAALSAAGGPDTAGGRQIGDPAETATTQPDDPDPGAESDEPQEPDPPTPPGLEEYDRPPVYDTLTPNPLQATADVPELYAQGCQVELASAEPVVCEGGDPNGEFVVAVVGDSKIAQWVPAIDYIATEWGWRVITITKSGCSPSTAMVWDDTQSQYEACREWSDQVVDLLLADPPDVYLTSGRRELAGEVFETRTPEAMTEGYVEVWNQLSERGVQVIAVSDSPSGYRAVLGDTAYACVADHPDTPTESCSWDYQPSPASDVLRQAVAATPNAEFIDIDPWLCPGGVCSGALRNIVTWRQGSHITVTFVLYLTPVFEALLIPLVDQDT